MRYRSVIIIIILFYAIATISLPENGCIENQPDKPKTYRDSVVYFIFSLSAAPLRLVIPLGT